jgi:hypothetical protein
LVFTHSEASAIVLGDILLDLGDIDAARVKAADARRHLTAMRREPASCATNTATSSMPWIGMPAGPARSCGVTVTPAEQRVLDRDRTTPCRRHTP